ncbi:MAG: hypothetical protein J2P37_06790 [Ktedonobacteraceae bacterium]|nr:hypothetical protein [Ktedonobacteraceae bacterium]
MSDETKELSHSLVSVCQEHRDRVLSLYARDEQQARDLAAPWIRKHHCDASQVTVTAKPEGSSSLPGKIPLRDMSQLSLVASVSSGGRCSGGTMIEQHREMARLRAQVEEEHAAAQRALYDLATGTARHEFMHARLDRMGALTTKHHERAEQSRDHQHQKQGCDDE